MEKIQFPVLKVDGSNYLMWALNAEIVLSMKLLSDIIVDDTNIDEQDKARATFIIRHHLDKDLQGQYLTAISPSELWQSLKRRFDHLRLISLPSARNEWMTLRVLDHPTIASYNSALFRITSQLSACGQPVSEADQIERTLSTFPPTNMQLAQVYRQMNFRQYSDLIAVMLLAEKNDLLLLHNSRARPAGTLSKPETQYASTSKPDRPPFRPRPPFRGYKGKRPFRPQPNRSFKGRPFNKTQPNNRNRDQKKTTLQCFKCGSPGHIQRDCRIPQHLVKLYQDSLPSSSSVTASNYMEIEEDLTLYTRPETHLVTYPATTPGEIPSPIHGDTCILDSGTSHSILRDPKYFHKLTPSNRPVTTITGIDHLEEAQGPATVILPNRTLIEISSAIYAPGATRNLLSFQDIRANNLHIRTSPHPHSDSLQIYTDTPEGIVIHETLGSHPPGLYATHIESHYNENQRISPTEIWHRRLGHPGTSMFHRILKDSRGIPPTVHPSSTRDTCIACAEGKLKIQPAISKIIRRIPAFLEEISIDVCGPISPPSGPFRYFMGMVCASSKWSQTSLLSTRNLVMARILTHIIRLKSQFPESPIRILCIDNAGEFQSPPFHRFCDTLGITIRYSVPYVHFQNGGAEAFMKTIQLIARPLLMQSALPPTAWGHAVIHGAALLKFRPSAFNNLTPHHLAHGTTPDLSHLKIFGCLALIPILGPNQTKMGPQRRKGIYVGYDSPSVIRYLDPSTADLFRARFQDCQFREDIFPTLQTTNPANKPATHKLNWQTEDATWQDQRTNMTNDEVNKILHLHQIMQDLPDAFNDAARVTKSHVEAANVPARIITTGHIMNRDNLQRKRRNPPGPTTHHKSKKRSTLFTAHAPPRPDKQVENEEISLNYTETGDILTRNEIEPDEGFATYISQIINSEDPDPRSVEEARKRDDWPHWETAIQDELDSLIERRVFGKLCPAPPDLHLTGYRITLVRKRDAQGNVARYKARLVAKGYTQIFGTDYDMTHAPVMDSITYRYLMSFSLQHHLRLHLMDVVTAYLYGTLDNSIHMQAPPELIERALFHIKGENNRKIPPKLQEGVDQLVPTEFEMRLITSGSGHATDSQYCSSQDTVNPIDTFSLENKHISNPAQTPKRRKKLTNTIAVQVLRSIYGLKQSGRIWYQRFKTEMLALGFSNNIIAPCLFIKHLNTEFIILAIYVDDISMFGTPELMSSTIEILKSTFEMKDIGEPNFCIGIQIERVPDGLFIHQSTYTRKLLKQFNMHKAYPVTTPMDPRSSDPVKDIFRKQQENEPLLGPEKPYLSAIGGLMFLANQTRPDMAFAVNLLARHSSKPTIRHWNGIKRIMRYLQGTVDRGLLYLHESTNELLGYADAGYLSDPDDSKSQTGYVFLQGGTAISWKSSKQTLTTTSSNHAEVIALYEACREAIWLRQLINHIRGSTGNKQLDKPTTIYEDNRPCVDQISKGFIKGDRIKHISPKFFYTAEQHGEHIQVEWIPSRDNRADLLTKPLPRILHEAHCAGIGMTTLTKLQRQPQA